MVAASPLTPEDYGNYAQQRRKVTNTYQLGLSDNTFQRSQADNAWTKSQSDLASQYGKMREALPDGYGSRGLLNSGIFEHALTDFGTQQGNAYGTTSDAHLNAIASLLQNRAGLDQTYKSDNAGIDEAAAASTAAAKANMIRAAVGSGGVSY